MYSPLGWHVKNRSRKFRKDGYFIFLVVVEFDFHLYLTQPSFENANEGSNSFNSSP